MSYITGLRCVSCNREYSPDSIRYTCPDCGPLLGTLAVGYDFDAIARVLTREKLAADRRPNHWRYLDILPVNEPAHIPELDVGWTPLYPARQLAEKYQLGNLWIKDDSRNPSASLKDRASSVAIVKALENNATIVTAASTGNAASSWSAFTALAGLKNYIFVPENAPRGKIAQLLLYGANVLMVKGTYDEAYDLCCSVAEEQGWYNRCTAINPYLGEGKKTAALEICEQLKWQAPDYLLVSVGDGCIYQGMWKGFKDFYALGFIDKLPKMIGVQAAGIAPLAAAWKNGADRCQPATGSTVADSISVGIPRDQIKALQAARESGGRIIAVSDAQILAAIRELATDCGVFAEPAGATALAGLHQLLEDNILKSSDNVVVAVTGHGLKDIDGVLQAVDRQPHVIDNSADAVREYISRQ